MSSNTVFGLFYGNLGGFFNGSPELRGLFSTKELAEKRLLEVVLDGGNITSARIDTLTVEVPFDPADPLNHPNVIASLLAHKKIQAIKRLREAVSGLGLREAKEAIEAVKLDELPEALRVEAEKVNEEERLEEERKRAEEARTRRFEPVNTWSHYNYVRDDEDDVWGHKGDGKYVLLNDDRTVDEWENERTLGEIRSLYGIREESDHYEYV